ncbi:YesL family protein [Saliterribacillus persicus]|uniref:Putative membrane protein YesL n=1 Tax=Saliterribacillus persicus TaxID=930114 RepID=A0A368Y924_9BACI|nr:DUF624 domain-containing protein [Saliterribacillus persicus]RCW76753.1 putative membrane protein YesL [Saliterribacillus persicus]
MRNFTAGYIVIGEWLFKVIILNLFWFLFMIAGLGLFGIFPATAALFATIRKDLIEEKDIKLFSTFWHYFKTDFLKANLLGYFLTIIGGLLIFNIRVLGQLEGSILNSILMVVTYILLAILALIAIYIFPVFVHFQLRFLEYIKYSSVLIIGKPLHTIVSVLLIAGIFTGFYMVPGLIPVVGSSIIAYVLMKIALSSFAKKEEESISN